MQKFLIVLSLILIMLIPMQQAAELPIGGKKYSSYIDVSDPSGAPVSGVTMKLTVATWYGNQAFPDYYFDDITGTTDANGLAYLEIYVPWEYVEGLSWMEAHMIDPDYAELSSENATTQTMRTIWPEFVVILDTDGNGIDDNWEIQLADKFCPTLKLHHAQEWIAPEPVEYINADKTSGLWFGVIDLLGSKTGDYSVTDEALFNDPVSDYHPWINNPNSTWETLTWDGFDYVGIPPGKAYGDYHLRFHFGFSGNPDPNGWSSLYQPERNNNNFRHTIYAHFFTWNNFIVIQYWFFYPYNDGHNNHEGDWEHINVIITSQNPDLASIFQVDFYFHKKVQTRTVGNFEVEDNTHPVIYVGGECAGIDVPFSCSPGVTTGGSYPTTGTWYNNGEWGYDEYVWGNGPYISYSEFIDSDPNDRRGIVILPEVDDIDYGSNLHMRWFKAQIPWGLWEADSPQEWAQGFLYIWPTEEGDVGNDGPPGPAYNSGWNTVVNNNSYDYYSYQP